MTKIKRALLSVSDKTGIVELAKFLYEKNIEIISTGGTAKVLIENGIKVIDISDYTNFPEILDGRVKTLHPKVHGGLLYKRNDDNHKNTVEKYDIKNIDLVVVNLYPFAKAVQDDKSEDELIENIDIGGPSMLRSAAKNFESVTVVTDSNDYKIIMDQIEKLGNTTLEIRKLLMGKVFVTTANYDAMIANQFSSFFAIGGPEVHSLRYGENPHQKAGFFSLETDGATLTNSIKLQGKDLSYNNILDADSALRSVLEFNEDPACVIVKHLSPCGIAIADTIIDAYEKALSSDSLSAFGGVVALNREITLDLAKVMNMHFLEVIIAPKVSEEAKKEFSIKENLRVIEIPNFKMPTIANDIKSVFGGFLVQETDKKEINTSELKVVTTKKPTSNEMNDLWFAWKSVKNVKSNAIVLVKNSATVGIGGGLTSRIDSTELAIKKAGKNANNSVCGSDAFFPFPDGPEALAKAGVTSIIQPGGSKNDELVIEKCNELGISMVFTGSRAFKH
jgi:phosphoribosylaminoimidazolecarboxamide formyltransferase/IMP cyclohydrolase